MSDDVSLYAYVRVLANTLGLTDWEIEVDDDAAHLPADTLARVNVPTGRRTARISLGAEYANCTPEDQRNTLVHELLHCHFDTVSDLAERTLRRQLGAAAWDVYEEAQELLLEQAIDAVAVAVGEFLPVPPAGSS
jgi:hypothetical protein